MTRPEIGGSEMLDKWMTACGLDPDRVVSVEIITSDDTRVWVRAEVVYADDAAQPVMAGDEPMTEWLIRPFVSPEEP